MTLLGNSYESRRDGFLYDPHLAVSRDGAADETTAIANTWALIHPLAVTNWAGSPLVYYRPDVVGFSAACPLGPLADMLQAGTGRCGTFAALFQSALAVNRISSTLIEVKPTSPVADGSTIFYSGFLVKNWDFQEPGSFLTAGLDAAYPGYPYSFVGSGPVSEMVPYQSVYGDMLNLVGIPGQGQSQTPTPSERVFPNHGIVCVMGNQFYDPSYGTTYGGPTDFEDNRIDGDAVLLNADVPSGATTGPLRVSKPRGTPKTGQ